MSRFFPIHRDHLSFQDRNRRRFEQMRDSMETELRSPWVHSFEDNFARMLGGPSHTFERRPHDGVVTYNDPMTNDQRFEATFDVRQYKPEDITIKVNGDMLLVEVKQVTDRGGVKTTSQFTRKTQLPHEVDPANLSCDLSNDGILMVSANYGGPASSRVAPAKRKSLSTSPGGGTGLYTAAGSSRDSGASPVKVITARPTPALDEPTFFNTDKGRQLVLRVELGPPYTADDINVKVDGLCISIIAEHVEKKGMRTSTCSVSRDFTVTEMIDQDTVTANMKAGVLEITAFAAK